MLRLYNSTCSYTLESTISRTLEVWEQTGQVGEYGSDPERNYWWRHHPLDGEGTGKSDSMHPISW